MVDGMTQNPERWLDAGAAVVARREELGWSQDELHVRSGISDPTIRKIERGTPSDYRSKTLRSLEKTLGWPAGTFRRLLAGKAITPPADETPADDLASLRAELEEIRADVARQADELSELRRVAEQPPDGVRRRKGGGSPSRPSNGQR